MLHWNYKNYTADTKSGVVLTLGTHRFDLSIEETTSLLWFWLGGDKHPEKKPIYKALAKHPVASIRKQAIDSEQLDREDLEALLTDVSSDVRFTASEALRPKSDGFDEFLKEETRKENEALGIIEHKNVFSKEFYGECGSLSYNGITVPMFADDFYNLFWESPGGDPFLDEGTLSLALIDSPAWKSPEIRNMLCATRYLNEEGVRKILYGATKCPYDASDDENFYLGWKHLPKEKLLPFLKADRDLLIELLTNEKSEEFDREIVDAIKEDLAYSIDDDLKARFDRLGVSEKPEEDGQSEDWDDEDEDQFFKTQAHLEALDDSDEDSPEEKPMTLHWNGLRVRLDDRQIETLIETMAYDVQGSNGTLLDAVIAAAKDADAQFGQTAQKLKQYLTTKACPPRTNEPTTAWLTDGEERFYLDTGLLNKIDFDDLLDLDEASRLVQRIKAKPCMLQNQAMREFVVDQEVMTRDIAHKLMKQLDLAQLYALKIPAFWDCLTSREIRAFVKDDPFRQMKFMTAVGSRKKILAVCPDFLDSPDPEIHELVRKRLAAPGHLDVWPDDEDEE